ncbi:MAG: response regulator transcription factor [Thermodesulfovibrionales bacterium]|nr:response regulator transcription factor [Thermodesulfovibrionales bacterium]
MKNKILVIDDDHDILKVLKANLEFHDFEVVTADSWTLGEEIFRKENPDLIVLDIMLPDGDGIEISRKMRKDDIKIPIILLTARDKISDKVIGLESGADDYVVKPFETIELIARIRACLRRSKPFVEEIVVNDIKIDLKRRKVTVKDNLIFLTPKEYDLLCLLVSNKGKVISREEIKRTLWKNSKLYSWSRVIDVHIQHLRQKIQEKSPDFEHIITVPAVGYMFKEE